MSMINLPLLFFLICLLRFEKENKPTRIAATIQRSRFIGLLSSVDDSGSGRVRQSLQWQYEK